MRKGTIALLSAMALLLAVAIPAAAHNLVVTPPNQDEPVVEGWAGGSALPDAAEGEGLIPGGPEGAYLQSPAHDGGLVSACEATRSNPVVEITGPPFGNCWHGGPPPAP